MVFFCKAILGKQITPEMRRTTLAGLNLNCSTLETVAGGDAAGEVLYIHRNRGNKPIFGSFDNFY